LTNLILSCVLSEFTFFLTLRPFPQVWEPLWVEQERLSSLSQFLCVQDLLLL
jgi:hypothetical protein